MSELPFSSNNTEKINSDDFAQPHEHEDEYDGDFAQHPAILDAYRLQALLDTVIVTDTAEFAETVHACIDHLNERLASKHDQFVTITAPSSHIIRSDAFADNEDGEVSVSSDAYRIASDIDTDDDEETVPTYMAPSEEIADSISGSFGGFGFLFEEVKGDDSEEVAYHTNLYVRVQSDFVETPLASATSFDAARLSRASITRDDDALTYSLETASNTIDSYRDTAIHEKLLHAERIINSGSFTLASLQAVDKACHELFAEKHMNVEFPIQDSLIALMKLSHSSEDTIEFTAAVTVQLEHIESVGTLAYFTPAQQDERCAIEIVSDLVDYVFLPRTITEKNGGYESSLETLGLYIAVQLSDEQIGYLPVEHLKDIA